MKLTEFEQNIYYILKDFCDNERKSNLKKGFGNIPLIGMRASDFHSIGINNSDDDINRALMILSSLGLVKESFMGHFITVK